jgi:hypothetical protein
MIAPGSSCEKATEEESGGGGFRVVFTRLPPD